MFRKSVRDVWVRTLQPNFGALCGLSQVRSVMTYVPSPGDGAVKTVTLIPGDGVGPEVCQVVVDVAEAMGAPIAWERFDNVSGTDAMGNPVLKMPSEVLDSIRRNKTCLKGTLFTPLSRSTSTQSLNVQLRKDLDLYANLVHGFSIPGLTTRYDNLNIVVIRENTQGEYSGLEHEVVPGVVESLKVVTWDASLRIAEYAFEYAFLNNRRKVTAVHKANIIKLGDNEFLKACRAVAGKYPKIQYEEMIVDNTCMQLVSKPQQFDVMVTPNFYGNLVANIVAGICGGPGICPGGNVGHGVAVFEQGARHVAANLAGLGQANPTAMLFSTAMLMRHLQLHNFSDRLERALLQLYGSEDRSVLTPDVGGTGSTLTLVNTLLKNLES